MQPDGDKAKDDASKDMDHGLSQSRIRQSDSAGTCNAFADYHDNNPH